MCVGLSGAAELCLLSLLRLGAGLAFVEPLTGVASVPLPAVFRGVSCRRLPLRGYASFLAPVACPAPALELYLLSLRCLWCGAWFRPCAVLFLRGRRYAQLPCLRLLFGVSDFSDTVCLTYCCASGLGWAASLPLCYQCSSCSGWLAGVRWVLHPVSGSSHRGCVCSLGDSVVVPFLAPLASRALFIVLSSPPAVLDLCGGCALFTACFPLP